MDDIITGDIGGRLRRAREQRGLSLHEAAGRTKLSISVLQAIERNDFDSLPGGIYRKGYLRSLAGEVGLNPKEIAAEYDKEFEPATNPAAVAKRNVPIEDKWARELTRSPRGSIVTPVILIALAIGWFAWPDGIEPPLPAATLAGELIPARPLLDPAAAAPVRSASMLAEGTMTSRVDVPLRIELAATDWCWVAAESDGKRALYRLVEPGERVVLEGHRVISLRLGNAGSVTLSINDGPRRLAGGDSEVVDVKLTPDNVEALRDGAVERVSGN